MNNKCELCEDTGKTPQADGPDDFEMVYCSCPAGDRLREKLEDIRNDSIVNIG